MMNYIFLALIILVFFLFSGIFVKTDNTDPSVYRIGTLVNKPPAKIQRGIQINQVTILTPTPDK